MKTLLLALLLAAVAAYAVIDPSVLPDGSPAPEWGFAWSAGPGILRPVTPHVTIYDYALYFNGASHVSIPSLTGFAGPMTVVAVVQPLREGNMTIFNNNQLVVRVDQERPDPTRGLKLEFSAFVRLSDSTVEPRARSYDQVEAYNTTWYFVVARWDGTHLMLFVGRKKFTSHRPGQLTDVAVEARIGRGEQTCVDCNGWVGYIARVYIYTVALTDDEVTQIYHSPDSPPTRGLFAWYVASPDDVRDVDGDGVLEWIDRSGNNNHGKIYGAQLRQVGVIPPYSIELLAYMLPTPHSQTGVLTSGYDSAAVRFSECAKAASVRHAHREYWHDFLPPSCTYGWNRGRLEVYFDYARYTLRHPGGVFDSAADIYPDSVPMRFGGWVENHTAYPVYGVIAWMRFTGTRGVVHELDFTSGQLRTVGGLFDGSLSGVFVKRGFDGLYVDASALGLLATQRAFHMRSVFAAGFEGAWTPGDASGGGLDILPWLSVDQTDNCVRLEAEGLPPSPCSVTAGRFVYYSDGSRVYLYANGTLVSTAVYAPHLPTQIDVVRARRPSGVRMLLKYIHWTPGVRYLPGGAAEGYHCGGHKCVDVAVSPNSIDHSYFYDFRWWPPVTSIGVLNVTLLPVNASAPNKPLRPAMLPWIYVVLSKAYSVYIQSQVSVADYQVYVRLPENSVCKYRVYGEDLRELPWWGQSCNEIWVKVPSIRAGTTAIYVALDPTAPMYTPDRVFIPNAIFAMSGTCSFSDPNCYHIDNHNEANVVRTYSPNICTKYVDKIDWGSVCDNSAFNTLTRDYFYSRFRFLFVAPVSGVYEFGLDSGDASELMITPIDRYGNYGGENGIGYAGEFVVTAWYGGHEVAGAFNYRGNVVLEAGQGVWIDVIHDDGIGPEGIRVGVRMPGWSDMQILSVQSVGSGVIFARSYVNPEPRVVSIEADVATSIVPGSVWTPFGELCVGVPQDGSPRILLSVAYFWLGDGAPSCTVPLQYMFDLFNVTYVSFNSTAPIGVFRRPPVQHPLLANSVPGLRTCGDASVFEQPYLPVRADGSTFLTDAFACAPADAAPSGARVVSITPGYVLFVDLLKAVRLNTSSILYLPSPGRAAVFSYRDAVPAMSAKTRDGRQWHIYVEGGAVAVSPSALTSTPNVSKTARAVSGVVGVPRSPHTLVSQWWADTVRFYVQTAAAVDDAVVYISPYIGSQLAVGGELNAPDGVYMLGVLTNGTYIWALLLPGPQAFTVYVPAAGYYTVRLYGEDGTKLWEKDVYLAPETRFTVGPLKLAQFTPARPISLVEPLAPKPPIIAPAVSLQLPPQALGVLALAVFAAAYATLREVSLAAILAGAVASVLGVLTGAAVLGTVGIVALAFGIWNKMRRQSA